MDKPRIALPEIGQDVTNYTHALFEAGMAPVLISVKKTQLEERFQQEYLDYADFHVENYDGLLLPGGCDVNPCRYGQENTASRGINDALDELQLYVLDGFVKAGKPVLGVCRGYQLINVYFGGTLVQDLGEVCGRHCSGIPGKDLLHRCCVEKGSWLYGFYGEAFVHNSFHHQAADKIGEGLTVDGWCPEDHVPESMHHSSLPIYSVQWHPERICLDHARAEAVDGLEDFRFLYSLCMEASGGRRSALNGEEMQGRLGL